MIDVTVERIGGSSRTVRLNDSATVGDALDAAGVELGDRDQLRLNGNGGDESTAVRNRDRVLVIPKYEGGRG